MSEAAAFCGCFGSPRGRQNSQSRPHSAPAKQSGHKLAATEPDEGWKIGSQVPQTPQPQTAVPTLSPGKPVDSIHGAQPVRGQDGLQGPAIRFPSGLSVKAGSHSASSTAALSPHKALSSAHGSASSDTAVQHHSVATGVSTAASSQQQQQSPDQRHTSLSSTQEAAGDLSRGTAALPEDQSLARSQQDEHGIPGFAAMTPTQQSAAILTKWGVAQPPELQFQMTVQQLEQQQEAQSSQARSQLMSGSSQAVQADVHSLTAPGDGHKGAAQDRQSGSATHSDSVASSGDNQGASADPDSSVGKELLDPVHADSTDTGPQERHLGMANYTSGSESAADYAARSNQMGSGQSRQQAQVVPDGDRGFLEHEGVHEGGLTLEQPDGEGSSPQVTPEVVRGRVVRATEMWHRQRLQQEASQQAIQMREELAYLQGQNQNEQLAVPLLRLAGAVQAALTWQQKVGEYSANSIADCQQLGTVCKQRSGVQKQPSVLAKKSGSGEVRRAVQHVEAQLRATRQDALQLATAVVRLEKEKAGLQSQLSGQHSKTASLIHQQLEPNMNGSSRRDASSSAVSSSGAVQHTVAHEAQMTAGSTAQAVLGTMQETWTCSHIQEWPQATQHPPTWPHSRQSSAVAAEATGQAEAAATTDEAAQTRPGTVGGSPLSPRSKHNRQKPWGSRMAVRSSSASSNGRGESRRSLEQGKQPARRGPSQEIPRRRSGFSMSSLLHSFLGGRAGSSHAEGNSPRQDIRCSPSFMDSTKSRQAHVHVQLPQAAALAAETDQDTHRHAFRPSSSRVVIPQFDDAQQAADSKAQHAQHEHSERSPRSVTSARASSFMDSTESSRAHHAEEAQHAHKAAGHNSSGMQQDMHGQDAESATAGQGAEMQPADVHFLQPQNISQSLHQAGVQEPERSHQCSPSSLDRAASLSSKAPEFGYTRRPSFMRPTASSLAHTASGRQTSLNKSLSMSNI